jgi:predicted ATPase with chaperone activity
LIEVESVKGALSIAAMAKEKGISGVILPKENANEAAVVEGINIYPVETLRSALEFINAEIPISIPIFQIKPSACHPERSRRISSRFNNASTTKKQ